MRVQLSKLLKIKQQTRLNSNFCIGYILYSQPLMSSIEIQTVVKGVEQVFMLSEEKIVSQQNILQLMVFLKFKVLQAKEKEKIAKIVEVFDLSVSELALDNKYFYNKYFDIEQANKIVQNKEIGLGIECSICICQIQIANLCILSCNHMYHKQCFNQYAQQKIKNKKLPIVCPDQNCIIELNFAEIQQFLSKQNQQKYDQFSFQNYVDKNMIDTSWCPSPDCKAVFTFDDFLDNYRCPACNKHYCLICRCQMHHGMGCEEYRSLNDLCEDDRRFMVFVRGAKYKQCPSCKFWVQKNQGCDHMTCRCKYQFCYICGGKYQACRCVNGQRVELLRLPQPCFVVRNSYQSQSDEYQQYNHSDFQDKNFEQKMIRSSSQGDMEIYKSQISDQFQENKKPQKLQKLLKIEYQRPKNEEKIDNIPKVFSQIKPMNINKVKNINSFYSEDEQKQSWKEILIEEKLDQEDLNLKNKKEDYNKIEDQ